MLELINCPCQGTNLDRLIQPAILAVLAQGSSHGYLIAEQIGAMPAFAGDKPDASGIYRFLKSMEQKGLVLSSWDVSESGPAKKCYTLTADGRRCLEQWIKTLDAYRHGITELLRVARKAAQSCS